MNSKVPALQRGIAIINLVAENRNCNMAFIEQKLGIPKASFSRLMQCLLENGILVYSNSNRNLKIGNNLICKVMQDYEKDPLVSAVKPVLRQLTEKWSVTFVVYEYEEEFNLIWKVKEEPKDGIMTHPPGFTIQALNINAQGQLFLSYLSDECIKKYVDQGSAVSRTKYTLVKYDDLLKRIRHIRKNGYAYQERESHLSMKQIAVPLKIRNINGIFALGCFLPMDFIEVDRIKEDMLLESSRFYEVE